MSPRPSRKLFISDGSDEEASPGNNQGAGKHSEQSNSGELWPAIFCSVAGRKRSYRSSGQRKPCSRDLSLVNCWCGDKPAPNIRGTQAVTDRLMFNNQLPRKKKIALICSVRWFTCCKYTHYDDFKLPSWCQRTWNWEEMPTVGYRSVWAAPAHHWAGESALGPTCHTPEYLKVTKQDYTLFVFCPPTLIVIVNIHSKDPY